MKKRKFSKVIAVALAAIMVIGMVPMTALAADAFTKTTSADVEGNGVVSDYYTVKLYGNDNNYINLQFKGVNPDGTITVDNSFDIEMSTVNGYASSSDLTQLGWRANTSSRYNFNVASDTAFTAEIKDSSGETVEDAEIAISGFGETDSSSVAYDDSSTVITTTFVISGLEAGEYTLQINYKMAIKDKPFIGSESSRYTTPSENGTEVACEVFELNVTKDMGAYVPGESEIPEDDSLTKTVLEDTDNYTVNLDASGQYDFEANVYSLIDVPVTADETATINYAYTGFDSEGNMTIPSGHTAEFSLVDGEGFVADAEELQDELGWNYDALATVYYDDVKDAAGWMWSIVVGVLEGFDISEEDFELFFPYYAEGNYYLMNAAYQVTAEDEDGNRYSFDIGAENDATFTTEDTENTSIGATFTCEDLPVGTYTVRVTYTYQLGFAYDVTIEGIELSNDELFPTRTIQSRDELTLVVCGHEGEAECVEAKPASCADGNDEYYVCPDCGAIFTDKEMTQETTLEDVTLPGTGEHVLDPMVEGHEAYVAPTCTETGINAIGICIGCGLDYVLNEDGTMVEASEADYDAIPALGHDYVEEVTKEATCTETGLKTITCSRCDEVNYTEPIDMIDHTPVDDPAVEPTCVEDGLTAGSHCEVCGTVLVAQEPVPATGEHTWDEGVVTKEAEIGVEGEMLYTCEVCGETKTEAIPALEEEEDLGFEPEYEDPVETTETTSEGFTKTTNGNADVEDMDVVISGEGNEINVTLDTEILGMPIYIEGLVGTDSLTISYTYDGAHKDGESGTIYVGSGSTAKFTLSGTYDGAVDIEIIEDQIVDAVGALVWGMISGMVPDGTFPYVVDSSYSMVTPVYTAVAIAEDGTEYPINVTVGNGINASFSCAGLPDGEYTVVVNYDYTFGFHYSVLEEMLSALGLEISGDIEDARTISGTDTFNLVVTAAVAGSDDDTEPTEQTEPTEPTEPTESGTETGETETETETGEGEVETGEAEHEHSYYIVDSAEATCEDLGWVLYACSECGDTRTQYTEALGHDYVDGVCTRCGALDPDYVVDDTPTAAAASSSTTATASDDDDDEFTEVEDEDEFTEVEEDEFDVVSDESTTSPQTGASMAAIGAAMAFAAAGIVVVTRKKKEED